MPTLDELQALVKRFETDFAYYKDPNNSYNEHSCRVEYIDPFLNLLGWDVANSKGLSPQYREVVAENYSTPTSRPDYTLTLRGVPKIFVEAKKPAVDISSSRESAKQARKYGWNAKHKIVILTNFEYLAIYDTTYIPQNTDGPAVARYRLYHYLEYVKKFDEITSLISRDTVYSNEYDSYFSKHLQTFGSQKQQVDSLFLAQINQWRVSLSNELYAKNKKYHSLEVLSDIVQEFINKIVFLRICEDKNLPLYHSLKETIEEQEHLQIRLENLFRDADKKYNSGIFAGESIVFDLNSKTISAMVSGLYYPESPYLFNIIEPNMLGKIYEIFLTEQLVFLSNGVIGLGKKKDCINRSVVTTPTEIVKYMVEKTLSHLCVGKTPKEILTLRIADISCGSGVFLEEAFSYLQTYCIDWYLKHDKTHLLEIGNARYKLPLQEKKEILCSCIYGIDIDIHAVEVAKFSLLIKLIENETASSVSAVVPILPELSTNIFHGNSLIGNKELEGLNASPEQLIDLVPFNWDEMENVESFDAILGNPPYVSTQEMHALLPAIELTAYKKHYVSTYKQFDKYFVFLERVVQKIKKNGYICFIVPNKFMKIGAGKKLRDLIASQSLLVSLDDFGATQLFVDKTIYSSIVLLQKKPQDNFIYSNVSSTSRLWAGENFDTISLDSSVLGATPWKLTTDSIVWGVLERLEKNAVKLSQHAEIFNGIQTSAERPTPVYWFSREDICIETKTSYVIKKGNFQYTIEKEVLKPYFKPTKKSEKGLNSYSYIETDKYIIFPYDIKGRLIPIATMESKFPGAFSYLKANYERLVPKSISPLGKRDVPNATEDTWYQYGRTQSLTAFINTPKLIVGILSQEPMYAFDDSDMLVASGGTAGYCAISRKNDSPYALEFIQAWLANPYTERIIRVSGSDFEGGFISRGTFVLSDLPFVELDLSKSRPKKLHDTVVQKTRDIYAINAKLKAEPSKAEKSVLLRQKKNLIAEIEKLIDEVYMFKFS